MSFRTKHQTCYVGLVRIFTIPVRIESDNTCSAGFSGIGFSLHNQTFLVKLSICKEPNLLSTLARSAYVQHLDLKRHLIVSLLL